MARNPVEGQSNQSVPSSRAELSADLGGEETRVVEAVVFVLIPEYEQAKVRDCDGHIYALTPRTKGVDPVVLKIGQRVACTVTRKLPRVLRAELIR